MIGFVLLHLNCVSVVARRFILDKVFVLLKTDGHSVRLNVSHFRSIVDVREVQELVQSFQKLYKRPYCI